MAYWTPGPGAMNYINQIIVWHSHDAPGAQQAAGWQTTQRGVPSNYER
jgi:hypothetical protein